MEGKNHWCSKIKSRLETIPREWMPWCKIDELPTVKTALRPQDKILHQPMKISFRALFLLQIIHTKTKRASTLCNGLQIKTAGRILIICPRPQSLHTQLQTTCSTREKTIFLELTPTLINIRIRTDPCCILTKMRASSYSKPIKCQIQISTTLSTTL